MDCARNIITANFSGGGTSATTAPLWQWDYGQVLCITGIEDLPAAFEVHFSTNRTGGVSTVAVGADGQVTIPNELLTIGKNLNAWIYLSDAQGEGETEYSILIPVKARPMPETYDAEVTGEFDDVVRQVSEYAETAQTAADNAGASASAAATSASEAAASASAAESAKTAAETAQGKAEDAQAAAETAAQTATEKAQQTAQDAAQAALDAGRAESAAGRAEAAQTGAESAKTGAETAAQGAAASASTATEKANLAGQAASAAAQSATAAAQSAASIEGDVHTASQKAAEATVAAGQAVAAKDAAQTAQHGAETSATNAGQSASTATTKAAEAAQSASNAAQSKTDAEAAATRAEQAAASLTIDSALSDTSVNPVQNKVIAGELTQVKTAITPNFGYEYTTSPGYINSDGSIASPGSATQEVYSSLIPVKYNQQLRFILTPTTGQAMWMAIAYYKADESFIVRRALVENSTVSGGIIADYTVNQTNAAYIRITWRTRGYATVILYDISYRATIADIYAKIADTDTKINSGSEYLTPIILSPSQPYVDINVRATTCTFNIPEDTLAILKTGYIQIASTAISLEFGYTAIGTSAIKIVYNTTSHAFALKEYKVALNENEILIAVIRRQSTAENTSVSITCPYKLNGYLYGIDTDTSGLKEEITALDKKVSVGGQEGYHVKSINHRGYSTAPENTIPAYKESKNHGFFYVETDISFTSDGIAVLLHDATINRTARNADGSAISGTINIGDITYAQALTYDFGIYKGAAYAGTKIPTFTEFIAFCRNAGLHPYIELKDNGAYTESQIQGLVDTVNNYGMKGNVTWISFSHVYLGYVKNHDASARLGLVLDGIYQNYLNNALALKTTDNDVFVDASYTNTDENISLCIAAGLPLEVWTVNSAETIEGLNPYISGVTSDNQVAYKILYEAALT